MLENVNSIKYKLELIDIKTIDVVHNTQKPPLKEWLYALIHQIINFYLNIVPPLLL